MGPILLLMCFLSVAIFQGAIAAECNVTDFQKVADAVANCQSIIFENVTVPGGETLRLPLREGTDVTFRGTTTFGFKSWAGPLVEISGTNVRLVGDEGINFDGQGHLYWDSLGEWGTLKPYFFDIRLINSSISDIYVINTPLQCVQLVDSDNVQLTDWVIDNQEGDPASVEPGKAGHNTNGFDIWNSTNVVLTNSIVYNQDDCVAIRSGANIFVADLICAGGHGLSISVGSSNESFEQNTLENVTIVDSILTGGENGIHIKTHVDGGFGFIKNVTYSNINFKGASTYGINIQENYRNLPPNATFPSDPKNNVPIVNLNVVNITGQVEEFAVPVYILCAPLGCIDWTFSNINVTGGQNNSCNFDPVGFNC